MSMNYADFVGSCLLIWDTGCLGFHQMKSDALSFWGQRKLLINTQTLWFILRCILQPLPLLLPPFLPLFSTYFFYSSSFCPPCPLAPPPPFSHPYPPLPPPAAGLGCCDVFVYSTTPPLMPPQYFGPHHLLLFLVPSCHHTEASVSACLPVANKVSPLFVGASFWRGRPPSKLIVHSLAFACRNLTT